MTDDERRIISEYVKRVAGAAQPASASASPWGGRAPSVAPTPQLPPVDRDADAMIAQLFQQYPEARYRITQTAFVQEHALVQAQNRIQELEWEVENASRQAQAANSRGFLGFGGSRPAAMPPRPMPQYPPGYNAQALQGRQGPGFLGTAMMTAAGVAGGMVLGNMLMNAFSGGGAAQAASAAAAAGAGAFGQEAVPTASAWTDPGAASGWGSPASDAGGSGSSQQDAAGAYDNGGNDASGGYDDASGGYDEEN